MTDEEKVAIFEQAGVDDEYLAEVDALIASGEFHEGEWTTVANPNAEPVSIVISMMPFELARIDRQADEHGKTRNQFIRERLLAV